MKPTVLTVSVAPFRHSGAGVARSSSLTMAALIPVMVMGVVHYGSGALAVLGLSVSTCMIAEALMQRIMGRSVTLYDGTAALTGVVLALMLPAGSPWWLVVVGAVSTIVVGKQIFGGLGSHPLNPVLVGWVMCRISYSVHMDVDASLVGRANLAGLSPLVALRGGYGDLLQWSDLCMGNVVGAIGSASCLVLAGGVVLAIMGVIKWEVSVSFLAGAALGTLLFGAGLLPAADGSSMGIGTLVLTMLFTGPVMMGAFFLATDPPSSPVQPVGMWIYGFAAGMLGILIQVKGNYYDAGVVFGILLVSLAGPLLDKIRPKARGRE